MTNFAIVIFWIKMLIHCLTNTSMFCAINKYILPVAIFLSVGQALPPPGRPQHVTVVSDVINIDVQWEPPTKTYGNIRRYIVSWAILPNFTDITSILDGDVTMSIISARGNAGRLFRIRIRAENDGGIGPYSLPKYVRIKCGREYNLLSGQNITVSSPGMKQGDPLKSGVLCSWKITTIAKYSLKITFNEIHVTNKSPEECAHNYIEISGVGRLCNNTKINAHVRTNLQTVQIVLRTGREVGTRGFRITFKSVIMIPGPPTDIKLRTSDRAIMITWRAPRENTFDITSYRISYRVVFRKTRFMITVGPNMRQFAINTNKFEGKLVEIYISAVIGMEEGHVSQKFIARAPCRRRITLSEADNVTITSPGYPFSYPSNIICTWYITSRGTVSSPITITYLDFKLEDTSFCSNDYVTFSFKENTEHECSTVKTPKTISTNVKNFTLTLVTDSRNEYPGFCIEIKMQAKINATRKHVKSSPTTTTNSKETEKPEAITKSPFLTDVSSSPRNNLTPTQMTKVSTTPSSSLSTATSGDINTSIKPPKQSFTKKNFSRHLTEVKNDMSTTFFYGNKHQYSTAFTTEEKAHDHEIKALNITQLENNSFIYVAEPLTSNFEGKSSSSDENGSHDDNDNGVLLAVLLSTISGTVVLFLSTCYYKWRRRSERRKINIEVINKTGEKPSGRYRSTNIEMHDILLTPSHAGSKFSNSRACVSHIDVETVPAKRHLDTILEYPEEEIEKENEKKSSRKRCNSFPFCLSLRRRKVHRQIQNALKSFSFIDDQQTLEKTLVRRLRLKRSNSF